MAARPRPRTVFRALVSMHDTTTFTAATDSKHCEFLSANSICRNHLMEIIAGHRSRLGNRGSTLEHDFETWVLHVGEEGAGLEGMSELSSEFRGRFGFDMGFETFFDFEIKEGFPSPGFPPDFDSP